MLILTVYGESDVVLDSEVWQERVESQTGETGVVIPGICLVLYHRGVTNLQHQHYNINHQLTTPGIVSPIHKVLTELELQF